MTISSSYHISSAPSIKDLPPPPQGKRGWPWTVAATPWSTYQADGTEWPRLSVITPSYNQGAFLEATIRSVLLQGYPNLEYIIIDGGSSDESMAVIRKYERWLSHWVSEPDGGQTDALNKGIRQSKGMILGWINSDDMYSRNTFSKAVNTFIKHPEIAVVHGNRILIDERDRVFGCSPVSAFNPPHSHCVVCSETAFWSRSAMDNCGLFDTNYRFAMDLEFFSRLFLQGKFLKLDDYLGYFRCHSTSKSSTIWNVAEQETIKIWHEIFNTDWPGLSHRSRKWQVLFDLIRHPLLLAIPYCQTRLDKHLNKV
jgi:glycosyltransferase involved in cell wall biosynthesis